MRQFVSVIIRNTVLVNVLMIMILLLGAVASQLMVREVFPEIAVDVLQVNIIYPGADPEEVEEGVSRKVEEAIDGIEGIKLYRTVSAESVSTTIIEVIEGFPVDRVYRDVRNAIDAISTFPVDAEEPIVSELTIRSEVILATLWGDQPERVFKEYAEQLKDELQALPSVSQVSIWGTRDYEIGIEISEEKLREYGLSFDQVAAAVRRGSLNLSGGQLRTKGEEIRLRTIGRKYTGEDFAKIVVLARPDGEIITLDRIATIRDTFVEDATQATFNGEPSVTLAVFKTENEDAIAIAREVREFAERKEGELPEGLHLTLWSDRTVFIESRLDLLLRNGLMGLAIVFFSLWLFLELRLSFWVTMGIPISLSGGLFIMWLLGSSLNEMSLFGLIMVLGIVVDDAIIIGEAIYVHRRKGDPPMLAAINGVTEVGLPVIAAVTTTIVAFLPLLFVQGVMGKFVEIIPVAVIAALTMSLIESLFLLPAHLNHLPEMKEKAPGELKWHEVFRQKFNRGLDFFIERMYNPFIDVVLHFRYVTLTIAVLVLLVTLGLVGGGFVKFIIFPEFDQQDIIANIEFPRGTPAAVTAAAVQQTEQAFARVREQLPAREGVDPVKNVQTVLGQSGGQDFERSSGNHMGFVRVELTPSEARVITAQELLRMWEQETGPIPGTLSQTFTTPEEGPPGAPVMITLRGQQLDTLLAVSAELKDKLRTYDGVYQVEDTFRPGKNELRIRLKPEARTLGLQLDDLARQVYAGYFGEEALRLQRGRDDIRVRVRYTEDERGAISKLQQARIRTPTGAEVPFFSVADVEYGPGFANITRLDGQASVSVIAEVDAQRANADEVLRDLAATTLPYLESKYTGWNWFFDGPQKSARDAFNGLLISFPLAMLGIFMIIASVFRSYLQPLTIMLTVPFGIIGAVWAHFIMGYDLALFSVFGMVALTGVVVNDAIVLIEAVNHNIASGMPFLTAVREGGGRRFRAIVLTTVSTVGGLAPLILETEAGAEVVIGMALSIAGGVTFATFLTLVYVPAQLVMLNDWRRVAHLAIHHRWPTREEVEPARQRYEDPFEEIQSSGGAEPIPAK